MKAFGVTLNEIKNAVMRSNNEVGGKNSSKCPMRSISLEDRDIFIRRMISKIP